MHDIAKSLIMKPARKKMWIAIAAVAGLAIFLILIKGLQIFTMISAGKKMTPPPETVTSAIVKEEDWAPMLSAVGSVSAVQGAVVSTAVGGMGSEIGVQNGTLAKQGDLLVKLDASQEEALLRSAEAEVELARTDLERTRDLASQNVVSKAELAAAESKFRSLTAVVDQMRSNIRQTTIVARFDGELGMRQVNVG